MLKVRLPDGSERQFDGPVTVAQVAGSIGTGLAKAALAGSYARVADSEQLAQLLMIHDVFPRFLRAAEREGLLRGLQAFFAGWRT